MSLEESRKKLEELKKKLGIGGTDICVCPNPECDFSIKHERGEACSKMICPKCGTTLVGKDMPHGQGQGAK